MAFPGWAYVAVAFLLAGAAFLLGQLREGLGMMFVAAATPAWVGYAALRARRLDPATTPRG